MFEHSVKVPRLYKIAAKVAKQVKEEGASLKDKVYQCNHRNIQGLFALISTVLQKSNTLDYIIRSTQILINENRLDPWLARVLISELLWGKNRLPKDSKPCQTVLNYSEKFNECLATFKDDAPSTNEKNKVKRPRYVRVNTIKLTMAEAINIFREEGWTLLRCGDNSDYGSFLATVASLSYDQFIVDMHIKDLLVFPPNTQFFKHYLYQNGDIILQDKASCLAPFFLSPEPKSSVLDMCSAPGMKASQLAAIIGTEGSVYAVERDQRRYQTLVKLMDGMSAENVKCINKDVLTLTNKDIPDVEYILVDPSCSGSGMLDRPDYEDPGAKCYKSRLQSLAGFQITILRHALNNFPKVKRVVYSTCSLYPDENESVIEQVITTVKDFKLVDLKENMKSKWFNFGSSDFGAIGERCLYAKPEDYTNGFFVALFERVSDGETNEFFVRRVKRSSECNNTDGHKENPENDETSLTDEKNPKKKKKSKQNKNNPETGETFLSAEENPKKKKKSKQNENNPENNETCLVDDENPKKKSKKNKNNSENDETAIVDEENPKKKKKSKQNEINPENETYPVISDENPKKKKKSKNNTNENEIIEEEPKLKKKKKSKNNETTDSTKDFSGEAVETKDKKRKSNDEIVTENKKRKKSNEITEREEVKEKKKKSKNTE